VQPLASPMPAARVIELGPDVVLLPGLVGDADLAALARVLEG
jgi:hypothetical protein